MNSSEDAQYFAQRAGARSDYNQALKASLFRDLEAETALDFGCGTGGIISSVKAKRKIGVEVGQQAAQIARANGIEVYSSLDDVPPIVDLAISHHALEHVDDDVAAMQGIHRVLKAGGRVRIVVPGEIAFTQRHWRENPEKHLRTWTPLSLGNIAERAGFTNIRTRMEPPPSASRGARYLGKPYRYWIGLRDNAFNMILDAEKA